MQHGYEVIDLLQNNLNCGIGFFTEESSRSLNNLVKQVCLQSRKNFRIPMRGKMKERTLNLAVFQNENCLKQISGIARYEF